MPSHFFGQVSWSTFGSALTIVVFIAAALIIILSRRREEVLTTLKENVSSLEGLLRTTKDKLKTAEDDLKTEKEKSSKLDGEKRALEDELKAAGLEYNQLALLDVAEWLKADKLKRENEAVRERNRELNEENRQLLLSQMKEDGTK